MPAANYYLTMVNSGVTNYTTVSGITVAELITSGYVSHNEMNTSGYVKFADILASGYIRNVDFLTSGYVKTLNGLKNTVTLVGSGSTAIWVDGQTIQIAGGAVGGGITSINAATGPAILLREQLGSGIEILTSGNSIFIGLKPIDLTTSGFATYSQLYTSGYIKNTDFITSGFILKSEVASSGFATRSELTTSGYLKVSDRVYPVDARATSGNIISNGSGTWSLGQDGNQWKNIFANSGIFQSGVSVSGNPVMQQINGLNGPFVTLMGSGSTTIWTDGRTIQIGSTGGAGLSQQQIMAIGSLRI